MKKYLAVFVLLVACQVGYSQKYNVEKLFAEFSNDSRTEKVKLGKIAMSFAGMFTETMGVDGVEVYAFDDCSPDLKEKLSKAIKNLKDSSYETMINANEEGSRTKVLLKMEDDIIRELVVITTGDSNALVRITGKIKPSDIERVTQKHGKGGC